HDPERTLPSSVPPPECPPCHGDLRNRTGELHSGSRDGRCQIRIQVVAIGTAAPGGVLTRLIRPGGTPSALKRPRSSMGIWVADPETACRMSMSTAPAG